MKRCFADHSDDHPTLALAGPDAIPQVAEERLFYITQGRTYALS